MNKIPALFGLANSNRDFSEADSWGKNQFNSSFPAALCCFMHEKGLAAKYLVLQKGAPQQVFLPMDQLFGCDPSSSQTYFAFEAQFSPLQKYVEGVLPRTDLVIQDISAKEPKIVSFMEVKLTALPDQTTFDLTENRYGSELVVRPDTIVYQAAAIAHNNANNLALLEEASLNKIKDWSDPLEIKNSLPAIYQALSRFLKNKQTAQTPLLLQPIWKTCGKSPVLADQCLDVFVWSDIALAHFICETAKNSFAQNNITRHARTMVWLYKMLLDVRHGKKIAHKRIIDELTYNTKNDKAFSSSGAATFNVMNSPELTNPRIHKNEIKNIILGNGHLLLSPERRFDAIIYNSPELFAK